MSKEKKKKTEKKDLVEDKKNDDTLLPYNPLMGTQPVQSVSVEDEGNMKGELIQQAESLVELNKQVLAAKQRETELIVDNRKLDVAKKLIEGINLVTDKTLNTETLIKVLDNCERPQDFKYMTESVEKMANVLKGMLNPSVADEFGNRKRAKIVAQFRSPDGSTASIGVDTDD